MTQVKPSDSSGIKVNAEPVPTAAETLEHLEQTLDNLDPVDAGTPADDLDPVVADAAVDAVIAEINAESEAAAGVPPGTLPAPTAE